VTLQAAKAEWYAEYIPSEYPKPKNNYDHQLADFIE